MEAVSVLFSVALSSSSVPCGAEVMLLFAGKVIATSNQHPSGKYYSRVFYIA